MTGGEILLGQSVFEWLSVYGYVIFPVLVILLGPVAGFAGGIFASLGVLNPFALYIIWVLTTTSTDSGLFFLGRFGKNFLNRFKRSRRILDRIQEAEDSPNTTWVNIFKIHFMKLFFFLKISPTVAISDMLAVVAGVLGIKFKRLYIASFLAQMIWSATFIALGYYLGGAIQDIEFLINRTGIILGILLVVIFVYIKYIHKYVISQFSNVILFVKPLLSKNDNGQYNSNKEKGDN